ncbi:MAG: OB-fold domain-containing protein [Halioglobus sp.]|nr:OB-fold domain-containing protein [Halioglobus sp.]
MSDYTKPLPEMEGLTGEFYDFCKQGELRFQQCADCGEFRHVPREVCAHCNSFDWQWAASSGRGRVYTWTVVERALHPDFMDATPLAPVVVELEEGVRLLTNLVNVAPQDLVMDMPVEVEFRAVTDTVTLPLFRAV